MTDSRVEQMDVPTVREIEQKLRVTFDLLADHPDRDRHLRELARSLAQQMLDLQQNGYLVARQTVLQTVGNGMRWAHRVAR